MAWKNTHDIVNRLSIPHNDRTGFHLSVYIQMLERETARATPKMVCTSL